jgi:glycosyltransferase involved in cell wall biosynthesis
LSRQTLLQHGWELIIVDNASTNEVINNLNLKWHSNAKVVKESKQGLTSARLRGFHEAKGEIIVLVDDDNLLKEDYLENTIQVFLSHTKVGIIGGKSIPEFEINPPEWFNEVGIKLGCRDLGEEPLITDVRPILDEHTKIVEYPKFSPIGTGMGLRKEVASQYVIKYTESTVKITDRSRNDLSSGGDNDIVLTALNKGWDVGYFPQLYVTHIIPKQRVQKEYLAKMNYSSSKSWVAVLDMHGIRYWPQINPSTILFRKMKSYFSHRAWSSPVAYIKWKGSCGIFEGQGKLE